MTTRAARVIGLASMTVDLLRTRDARADGARLLVFLHVSVKQRAFEGMLQAALQGATVAAVGRIADLERGLEKSQDAVLSLPLVLVTRNLEIKVQGYRGRASDESYSLVATDSAPDAAKIASVGALDLLGREGTTSFVQKLLGATPKVERVTKIEDLLPLLQMQTVDAVLLPSRMVEDLKASSRLPLAVSELSKKVALPALSILTPKGSEIAASLAKLPRELTLLMGVDEWR
jgi:hypothetical protein